MLEILGLIAFMVVLAVFSYGDAYPEQYEHNSNVKSAVNIACIVLILAFIGVLGPIGLVVGAVIVYARWSKR